MTTLPAFILAQIAADEQAARDATPGPWEVADEGYDEGYGAWAS